MYLSKLEIFGFKSFAHKVAFHFNDGITAIIGPNGCGKSNIVDSIRWVLGEQRPSLLRLERMENVIFNGTAMRKPLSLVEVSILIENTKNILPAVYSDVKITRRFYRSGDSDYLINNRLVRLKDVVDLFADTGMGSDAYSVIELKMVEQILSDNAEERRRLFEEAAGIKKYKIRRKSALRKLETTDQELVRLNDVMLEVQKNVNSLSRQVGKARRYHQYKEDLKINEIYAYQLKARSSAEDLIPYREEFDQVRQTRERLGKEVNQREAELEKLQLKSVDLEGEFRSAASQLRIADEKVREIQQQVQLNEQKVESIKQNISERKNEIEQLQVRNQDLHQQMEQLGSDKEKIMLNVQSNESEYEKNIQLHNEVEERLEDIKNKYNRFREENVSKLEEINKNRESYQKILFEKENLNHQVDRDTHLLSELEKELEDKKNIAVKINSDLTQFRDTEKKITNEISKSRERINNLEKSIEKLENERNVLLGEIEKVKGKKDFLHGLIENYEGFSEGVQFVMSRKKEYDGLIDTLVNLVDIEEKFRPALESYLEELSDYLVVEGISTAKNILSKIRNEGKGRLTLIPLANINTKGNGQIEKHSLDASIVLLKDIVKYNPRFDKLFSFLFDRVALVDNIDSALAFHKKFPNLRFITQDGDIVGEWGSIRGGNSHNNFNLTGRKNEFNSVYKKLIKLENRLPVLDDYNRLNQDKLSEEKNNLGELETKDQNNQKLILETGQKLNQVRFETDRITDRISEIQNELSLNRDKINVLSSREEILLPQVKKAEESLQRLDSNESRLRAKLELADQNYRNVTQEVQEHRINLLNEKNQIKEIEQKLDFTRQTLQEAHKRMQQSESDMIRFKQEVENIEQENEKSKLKLDELYKERDKIESNKNEVENNYQALKSLILSREEEVKKSHRRWNQALERLKELELKIQEIEIKQKTQQDQVEEQYGGSLKDLLDENPVPDNLGLPQLQEDIHQIKQRLESLGEVNPLAVKEYDKEKERLDFLRSQQADLLKAKEELIETISKLNNTARKQFLDTFDKIASNFHNVFSKFFEGSEAELRLVENGDPLEADIEISVHLKGRKLSTLSLLSAGEKTLTAISLLFAIYLYKPSPFCILDEVDAPLDDVNISRYTHALKEFSKNTQFILVTHNKMTMQAAQAMYGITMEEPGVSKVVSVRFD